MFLVALARVSAQDVIYSQFYANPLYLNPALAGSKLCSRLTLNYRNQWPGMGKGYVSYSTTWDEQFDKLAGGVGVIVNSDVAGGGLYSRFSASGIYSYRLQASRFIVLNAAVQAGYLKYSLNWDKMLFREWIDPVTGDRSPYSGPTSNMQLKQSMGNVDFNAGILAGYKESFYVGAVVSHLNKPDVSFYSTEVNNLHMRLTAHAGALFNINNGLDGALNLRDMSISPNIVYVQQGDFKQLNAGMALNLFPLEAGLWIRENFNNPDGVIVLLGYEQLNYKIGYSFDYTISRLRGKSASAHEISIAILFNKSARSSRLHPMGNPAY